MYGFGYENSRLLPRMDDVLTSLFKKYNGYFQVAAQKSIISGTQTTWIDYAGVHDIANPAAGNQPITNNPDSDFNNKKSATFVTDDYLIKNTANYGVGQTSGSIWAVIKTPSVLGSVEPIFAVCNDALNLQKLQVYLHTNGEVRIAINDGITNNIIRTTTGLLADTVYIIEVKNNGATNEIYVNGVSQTTSVFGGSNTGWFDYANTLATLNNISVGARINLTSMFYNGKIAYVSNFPLLSTPDEADMFNKLNSYYGVY